MAERRSGGFPVMWLVAPALGTWAVFFLYIVAINVLPTSEWLAAFRLLWNVTLALCAIVLCAIGVALIRFHTAPNLRTAGNFLAFVSAPIVAGVGTFLMIIILSHLSGM
jgi:hypothetical protein